MSQSRLLLLALAISIASMPAAAQQDTTKHASASASASAHGKAVSTTARTTATSSQSHHYTQAELEKTVKVSKDSAQAIALARVANGTVSSSTLEHARGTTVWSFDVAQSGKPGYQEVLVSAISGRVLWMGHESPAHERAERRTAAATKKTADTTRHQ